MEASRRESKVHVPAAIKMKESGDTGAADQLYSELEAGGGDAVQKNLQPRDDQVEETQCFLAICDDWCDQQVNKCCRSHTPSLTIFLLLDLRFIPAIFDESVYTFVAAQ